ncbi:MAG: beta-lactamase family protein [Caulobacterales bacterium]|nr:beta-lactamase family protein [Caulobacterales bacterium]
MRSLKTSFLACAMIAAAGPVRAQAPQVPGRPTPTLPAGVRSPKLAVTQPLPAQDLAAFVDGVIAEAMASDHIAGAAVAIVQDGRILLLRGYGVSHLDPSRAVDPQRTLFQVGSLSKTFTWIAVMKEVERRRLRLEAPVNDYLPDDLKIPAQGFRKPIRVIDLMSHAAGFEDSAYGHLIVDKPERIVDVADYLKRHRPRRVREPGLASNYSNYGANLAGYIVARLNGTSYQALIEREILRPLGLADTSFREAYPARADLPSPMPPALTARLSTGFEWSGARFTPAGREYMTQGAPAGAASMTAADAARYMLMQLGDGTLGDVTIYGAATARAFRTPILDMPEGFNGWAHGFAVTRLPGGFRGYGHSGATQFFFTNLVVVPQLRLGVFVTTNTSTGRSIGQRLPRLITGRYYAAPKAIERPGDPTLVRNAARYAGAYLTARRPYHGLEKFVELMGGTGSVAVTGDGRLVTSYGVVQTWVPAGAPGQFLASDGDDRLVFQLDKTGRAVSFPTPSGNQTMERVSPIWTRAVFDRVAALAMFAAATTWIVAAARIARGQPATRAQAIAGAASLVVSTLWVSAAVATWTWRPEADSVGIMYRFPGPWLATASSLALLATVGAAGLTIGLPMTWRGGGWPIWRRAVHSASTLVFLALGVLVGLWGGLLPWR